MKNQEKIASLLREAIEPDPADKEKIRGVINILTTHNTLVGKEIDGWRLCEKLVKGHPYMYAQRKGISVYIGSVDTLEEAKEKIDAFLLKNKG